MDLRVFRFLKPLIFMNFLDFVAERNFFLEPVSVYRLAGLGI